MTDKAVFDAVNDTLGPDYSGPQGAALYDAIAAKQVAERQARWLAGQLAGERESGHSEEDGDHTIAHWLRRAGEETT